MRYIKYLHDNGVKEAWLENDKVFACSGSKFNNELGEELSLKVSEIKLKCPCTPTKVFAVALNYKGLIDLENFTEPVTFIKPKSAVIGPDEYILNPFEGLNAWGEPELAVVLKKELYRPKNIYEIDDCIWGYTVANDVTVENIDNRDHHLVRSKGVTTFCPLGPWVDVEFQPQEQKIYGGQNFIEREGTLDQMYWDVKEALFQVSQWVKLEIEDVVIMGTPPFIDNEISLKEGNEYIATIEGLGELRNKYKRR